MPTAPDPLAVLSVPTTPGDVVMLTERWTGGMKDVARFVSVLAGVVLRTRMEVMANGSEVKWRLPPGRYEVVILRKAPDAKKPVRIVERYETKEVVDAATA